MGKLPGWESPHLRVVPDDPDPAEFPPRRFACLDRPASCVDCHAAHCDFGRTPGQTYANFDREVFCLKMGCKWHIEAPDHDSALAAYERHLVEEHGGVA